MTKPAASIQLHTAPVDVRTQPLSLEALGQRIRDEDLGSAYARGVQDGAAKALEEAAGALQLAVERLDAAREHALEQMTVSTVELSIEIARQLIQVEIEAGHYDLERIIRMSLAHSGLGRGAAQVHVSPEDHERLSHVTFRKGTEIVPNTQLESGDVHVESPNGLLVREIDACLENIREALLEDIA